MGLLLDANILIDGLVGQGAALLWLEDQPRCCISVITWIEVLVGCGPGECEAVEVWLRGFHGLPLDAAVAREAVDCRRTLGLKVPDAILLATALAISCAWRRATRRIFLRSWPVSSSPTGSEGPCPPTVGHASQQAHA